MLRAGRTHGVVDEASMKTLRTNPPFVLKLSHRHFPKRGPFLYSRLTNGYHALKIATSAAPPRVS